jgi:hypothetical protein
LPLLLALSMPPGLGACGDDSGLGVQNVSPTGSVGGLVINAVDMKPMSGVGITIIAGGKTYPTNEQAATATDARGVFSVQGVPAGEVIVRLTPSTSGFRPVDISSQLQNSAGEFPLGNATLSMGPIGLVPVVTTQKDAFRVMLITADGAPAPGVKGFLRTGVAWIDFSSGVPLARGTQVVSTTSSSSTTPPAGLLRFQNLTDFSKIAGLVGSPGSNGISDLVTVRIPPSDTDNDGELDFLGTEVAYAASKLGSYVPTIVLRNDSDPPKLQIEAASVAALMGKTGVRTVDSVSGPLYATFNYPLDKSLTSALLYDEGGKLMTPPPGTSVSNNVLTLQFSGLKQGGEYNILIYAAATVNNKLLQETFGAPFFTPATSGSKVTASLARDTIDNKKIWVTFSEAAGTGVPDQNLEGSNAIIYVGFDLKSSGKIGDEPGERGSQSSPFSLMIDEKDPPGPAGKSGLSSRWWFTLPLDGQSNPIPGGTPIDFLFTRSQVLMQRASGAPVGDMKNLTVPN